MQAGSKLFLLIATPVVLLMHLLVFLGCQWSISCRCTVGYKQCNDIDSAELVRVYPAPNCGLEELVPLQVLLVLASCSISQYRFIHAPTNC
jgi:hypothetical protein